jgi:predicted dehydrogenase
MSTVRVGIVGAGGIAQGYGDVLAASSTLQAVGVVDVRAAAAAALAERVGCGTFADLDGLLGQDPDTAPEVVVVCTPPDTHPAIAERLLRRGVPVLSEKPLAVDRDAAAAMIATADECGTLLGMATKFRFCADVVAAKELITSGALGEVRLAENAFTSRVDMSGRWNSDPAVAGGGVLVDNGTHSVDLIRFLLGEITEVLAVETCRPAGLRVEDTVRLHLRTDGGTDAHVDLSWSIDKSLPDFLKVFGTDAEVRVGWRESAWRRYGEDWQILGPGYAKVPAMGGALDHFCRAVRGEEALTVSAADGLAAAHVLDAAYLSLAQGAWAKVTPTGS